MSVDLLKRTCPSTGLPSNLGHWRRLLTGLSTLPFPKAYSSREENGGSPRGRKLDAVKRVVSLA